MGSDTKEPKPRTTPVTAYDVARLAGVSQSAVSRAFTAGASVSPKTRTKVAEAAAALAYRPNLIARSLTTRRSGIVGVAMAYLESQFYPALLRALADRLREAGLRILLFTADPDDADPMLDEVLRYQLDALVLASTQLSSRLAEECATAGVPVLLINRTANIRSVSSVTGDNAAGARAIAAFLVAGEHERFAYMAGAENSSTNREREDSFRAYLVRSGFGPPVRAVGSYTMEGARDAARSLLSARDRPDAIFCANDQMALATIEVARSEFGLEVGKNLSVVGFDDVPLASWPTFSLTTCSQPVGPMVDSAVNTLEHLLGGAGEPVHTVIPGQLIVRSSARIPSHGIRMVAGQQIWEG